MLCGKYVWLNLLVATSLAACSGETGTLQPATVSSCMQCHNGTLEHDYGGPGIENPHPFAGADMLACTTCHGGNPTGTDKLTSHVPPPPAIGDQSQQLNDDYAWFNRLTLAGMDKIDDYVVNGHTYTAIDYLRFINPGDLRVTRSGQGCGQCHASHSDAVSNGLLATEAGIWSGASFAIGMQNQVPANAGLHHDTAADMGFRTATDPHFDVSTAVVGAVGQIVETAVHAVFGSNAPHHIFNNNAEYNAAGLADDRNADNSVITDSPLARLFVEQVSFTCGDCHLGSAGQNNRAGDYRSSGCSSCHMPYSLTGRAGTHDPNVSKAEPLDPSNIAQPEHAHVRSHRIASISKTGTDGKPVPGIDDHTCAGCHQGSNRTVMQYWGIRLDQNADVHNGRQYPANPVTNQGTQGDDRLFDPVLGNTTFNGRNANQYVLKEDYDGDGRDDTPPDVHYEAGLGCIDCHGSHDMHGGNVDDPNRPLLSRMEQNVAIRCENCHGNLAGYAATQAGTLYDGTPAEVAVDGAGNPLHHVYKTSDGKYWLKSRLTGAVHFIPQTRDTVVNSGVTHPTTGQPIYNAKASYAMGRIDTDPSNGIGPRQTANTADGFSHSDNMDCVACHGSWTNTCMGCHLSGDYNTNQFSNVTGERQVYRQRTADFTYQSPLFFQLGVNTRGRITQFSANTKVFYRWRDQTGQFSRRFGFTDRNGGGTGPGTSGFPSLSHNSIMAHSIRGKVTSTNEGPRYCVACHLTTTALANFGPQYDAFRTAMTAHNFGALDFNLLKTQFGKNTGNQLNSPFFAHMAAGLGTGLFLFDEFGAPVNPLDTFAGRKGTDNNPAAPETTIAPSTVFDPARVYYDLDRIVEWTGVANGSNNHAWLNPAVGPSLRDGATDPDMAGPLGATIIKKLADPVNGVVLDSWLDANGNPQGDCAAHLNGP
jgi:hypothetical protein